jgi:hypothetical protein
MLASFGDTSTGGAMSDPSWSLPWHLMLSAFVIDTLYMVQSQVTDTGNVNTHRAPLEVSLLSCVDPSPSALAFLRYSFALAFRLPRCRFSRLFSFLEYAKPGWSVWSAYNSNAAHPWRLLGLVV